MTDKNPLHRLFIGTSGWSYRGWADIFYPKEVKSAKYLEYYTTRFDCVELNSSFYHLPKKTTAAGWMKRSPEAFKFCPKISRYITHRLRLANVKEPMQNFFDVFSEMKGRLGPFLVQLPPGLRFDKSVAGDFLELLKKQYGQYRFALEVRHKSWIADEFFNLMKDAGAAFVIADSGKRFPCHEGLTADFVYLRFHGRDSLYSSDYSDSDLMQYAEKIIHWLKEGKEVWAFFNNDFHAFAVKNAEKLKEIIHSQLSKNRKTY